MATSYEKLPGLAGFYFEDSYVLDIIESPQSLAFALEIVLTEDHPEYQPPLPGEAYCYRRGSLTFTGYRELQWLERANANYTDATGEVDHGNIDRFVHDGKGYELSGDWGRVRIHGGTYTIELTDTPPPQPPGS